MGRIVTGFDGSTESQAALDWAARAAVLRSAVLEIVHTYDIIPIWQLIGMDSMVTPATEEISRHEEETIQAIRKQAKSLVDEAAADVRARTGADVRTTILENRHPAQALTEVARDAEMLVVGSRGRGGVAGLLLGSVSRECASRSTCPVVIVREPDEPSKHHPPKEH